MKNLLALCCLVMCSLIAEDWPKIYDSKSKGWGTWEKLEQAMSENQIIYVGELHDHAWGHKLELTILEKLFSNHPNVAIALEMFERDIQNVLDGYLAEEVNEDFFLRNSRPWGNYQTDYRPLIEFVKIHRLPAIAMNVPRRYASFVAKDKEKELSSMPNKEKNYMAKEIKALSGKYRDKFYEIMGGHVPPALIERYYRSQCLKDDTMAESLVAFLQKNPTTKIISYTGAFHSDEGLGLVEKVDSLSDTKKIVISIVPVENDKFNPQDHSHKGDFILFAPANKISQDALNLQLLQKYEK